MCIIVIKGLNSGPITDGQWVWLSNCFANNKDGAGFMYVNHELGAVEIVKGLMSFDYFKDAVVRRGRDGVGQTVFHFRTSTHGTVCPENTHPFPLSPSDKQLSSLELVADVGVVHNGILPIAAKDGHSDTYLFVRDWLSPFKKVDKKVANLLALTGDKFTILSAASLWTIGNFVSDGAWEFSNAGYKSVYVPFIQGLGRFHYPTGYGWDDYEEHQIGYRGRTDDGSGAGKVCGLCKMWVQASKIVRAEALMDDSTKDVCTYCMDEFWSEVDDWGSADEVYLVDDKIGMFDRVEI